MPQTTQARRCSRTSLDGNPCGNRTTNQNSDCGQHSAPLTDFYKTISASLADNVAYWNHSLSEMPLEELAMIARNERRSNYSAEFAGQILAKRVLEDDIDLEVQCHQCGTTIQTTLKEARPTHAQ